MDRLLELSPTQATVEHYTPNGFRRRIFRLFNGRAAGGWSLIRETLILRVLANAASDPRGLAKRQKPDPRYCRGRHSAAGRAAGHQCRPAV